MRKILFIGNLEANPKIIGGQHTRTRNVYALLLKRFGETSVKQLDLSQPKPLLFLKYFLHVFRYERIVILCGPRSLPVFLFLLFACKKLPSTTIVAIGGWLGDFARRNMVVRSLFLPLADRIFVETKTIKSALYLNAPSCKVSLMPNFSFGYAVPAEPEGRFVRGELRLVFLSRVCRAKGVYLAIDAVRSLREKGYEVALDIYGPREADAEADLTVLLDANIRYMGVLPPDQVVSKMGEYDVFVFPTSYPGEGFPGVIVEAYRSGTPVVCSDWKSNPEVVTHNQTGLIFSLKDGARALEAALLRVLENRELLQHLSTMAREEAKFFDPDAVAMPLIRHLNGCMNDSEP